MDWGVGWGVGFLGVQAQGSGDLRDLENLGVALPNLRFLAKKNSRRV